METDWAFEGYHAMTFEVALARCPSLTRDRDIIRVDFSNDKLGIANSLRQAFAASAQEQCTYDFDELLAELD